MIDRSCECYQSVSHTVKVVWKQSEGFNREEQEVGGRQDTSTEGGDMMEDRRVLL